MRRIVVLLALVLGAPGVFAAPAAIDLDPVDTDHSNLASARAALFANYLLACHGLQYQRHQRTANDLGVPEALYLENLAFNPDTEIGDHITSAMPAEG